MLWNNFLRIRILCFREQQQKSLGKTWYVKFRMLRFKWIIKFRNYLSLVNLSLKCWFLETAVHRYFSRKVFLNISHYSQENTEALEALLSQNTCGGCFWIFAATNTFFQLNLVFIADGRTGFCSKLLWKQ